MTYGYLANSGLIDNLVVQQSGATRLTVNRSHDYLNRLQGISSTPSGGAAVSYGYVYNDANQRAQMTLADGSRWIYEYDALGQVKSGKRYWSDWTPVAGQQFEYVQDDIGNRTSTKVGGDASGSNLRSASYTPDNLNRYTSRTVPGAVDVTGIANASATVTVNSQTAYRKGEYVMGRSKGTGSGRN